MADKIRMDISGIALGGMKTAEELFDNSATRVARIGTTTLGADGSVVDDGVDLSTETVSMLSAKQQFQTNARVIRTSDEMQKSLLDVLA